MKCDLPLLTLFSPPPAGPGFVSLCSLKPPGTERPLSSHGCANTVLMLLFFTKISGSICLPIPSSCATLFCFLWLLPYLFNESSGILFLSSPQHSGRNDVNLHSHFSSLLLPSIIPSLF